MRVILIHHRLGGYSSHHFNEAHGFMRELGRRGDELILLVNAQAPPGIVAELRARAVFDDPTFRLEWSFEERSRRFRKMLHRHVDPLLKGGDRLLLTISTQLEAHALTLWSRELPRRKKPWIVILFLSDRWNRSGRDEYERQASEFHKLQSAIASLPEEDAARILFYALTDPLAAELSELLGTRVDVSPIPQPLRLPDYRQPAPSLHAEATTDTVLPSGDAPSPGSLISASHPPRVAILGGTRREKGSYLIPEIVRACRPLVSVEFFVQLTNNTLTAEDAEIVARIAEEPEVTVIREAMSLAEYEAALAVSDIALFPYEVIPYRQRISGVFAEAAASGKPVVATAGTWMAGEIESGRAAGAISEDLRPESFARAIARCVGEIETLQSSAQAVSVAWRDRGLSAFVDFMEREISRRSRDEKALPRSF
jgi:hypothetical protein